MPPPLINPPSVLPYKSFSVFVAKPTSSNYVCNEVRKGNVEVHECNIPQQNTLVRCSSDGSRAYGILDVAGTAHVDCPRDNLADNPMGPVT
jgi:hypothetical protein